MKPDSAQAVAEAFERSLAGMAATVAAAIDHYAAAPSTRFDQACRKWKDTALRVLIADLKTVKRCLLDVGDPRNARTLLVVAGTELDLAKALQTYDSRFAGPRFDRELQEGVALIVNSASKLLSHPQVIIG